MMDCVVSTGIFEVKKENKTINVANSCNKKNQTELLKELQRLHNNYAKGLITDKNKYKEDREIILKQLTNKSLKALIAKAQNIYLKNYYKTFLK